MEEKKRPWWQLFNAAVWAGMFWMRLDTYTDVLPIHDRIFSPEAWQKLQADYMAMFCLYISLVLLSLLRFLLYKREILLIWAEAITTSLACICGAIGLILHPTVSSKSVYLLGAVLLFVCLWSWYDLWRRYRNPK